MNRDLSRLKELVNVVLPAAPDESFNLRKWRHRYSTECATVYCACGWAAMHPPFREAGLRLLRAQIVYAEDDYGGAQLVYVEDDHTPQLVHVEDDKVQKSGYDAAATFFNIGRELACYFFNPTEYESGSATTKQQVIDRIKQYLVKNSDSTISVDTYLNITESCCNDVVS